jgi:hypothetical protein
MIADFIFAYEEVFARHYLLPVIILIQQVIVFEILLNLELVSKLPLFAQHFYSPVILTIPQP